MANEMDPAKAWLYSQLHGDAELVDAAPGSVHFWIAPEGTVFPYLTFQFMGGSDLVTINGTRVWANTLWLVKATVKAGAASALAAILDRVDAVLDRTFGTIGAARVYWSQREGLFSQATSEKGITYLQEGAFYRIKIQSPAAA